MKKDETNTRKHSRRLCDDRARSTFECNRNPQPSVQMIVYITKKTPRNEIKVSAVSTGHEIAVEIGASHHQDVIADALPALLAALTAASGVQFTSARKIPQ